MINIIYYDQKEYNMKMCFLYGQNRYGALSCLFLDNTHNMHSCECFILHNVAE